ncbi:MAG: hypothetical protein ACYC26_10030 [Phycisphaerales bacterium]
MNTTENILRNGREMIAKLQASPDSFAEYNELLSLFFKGLPIAMLGELLRHANERVVSGALFFAEELGGNASHVLDEIIGHVHDQNPRLRISAFDAICNVITCGHESVFIHVVRGMHDTDWHCRKMAMLWMMRVPETWLSATLQAMQEDGSDPDIQAGLRMLLGESCRDITQIKTWILDGTPLVRKFGMIAAGRSAEFHPQLLELAAQSEDADLRECATVQIHFRALLQKKPRWSTGDQGKKAIARGGSKC